ncbi:UNVERIFIED_CONTAM: hypothetical protein RMT77_013932 [Armadillidium vulgare]
MRKNNSSLTQGSFLWLLLILLIAFSFCTMTKGASLQTPQDESKHQDTDEKGATDDIVKHKPLIMNSKHFDKRSTNDDYVDPSDYQGYGYGYDSDTNTIDPGYESYLQSIQYDPMMAWGRRKRNRYIHGAKRTFGSYENPKNEAYLYHLAERRNYPKDDYMESVYLPQHFMPSFKRSIGTNAHVLNRLSKRSSIPTGMGAKGFHEGIFTHNFGDFSPVRRKREIEKTGGEQDKMTETQEKSEGPFRGNFAYPPGYAWNLNKRRFGMDASGFHGDTFNDGWGTFSTMRKRLPEWDSSTYQGDQFTDGYGYFDMMNKRRPEMDAMGFHGDTFGGDFGNFYTMKRRPEMDSSGFYGDTFSSGFGDFYTMKKREVKDEDNSNIRLHKREVLQPAKRRPEMTSSGFYGDTFSNGFGDFYTMKRAEMKRRPEMTSSGFYGDTFSNGFGDFYTMRKRLQDLSNRQLIEEPFVTASDEQKHEIDSQNDRKSR